MITGKTVVKRIEHCIIEERGITLYEAAKRADIPKSTLYNMISRESMPDIETLVKIADGLGEDPGRFIRDVPICNEVVVFEDDKVLIETNHKLDNRGQKMLQKYAELLLEFQRQDVEEKDT